MSSSNITTVNISPLFGDDTAIRDAVVTAIGASCRDTGFLCITGTGVPPKLVADMHAILVDIFGVSDQSKRDQTITRQNYRGYIPMGYFAPNDGSGHKDNYEGYKLHRETAVTDPIVADCALYGPNLWPRDVDRAKDVVLRYWAEMDRVALALLGALAQTLELPKDTFSASFDTPMTNMTLLHYPPQHPEGAGFGIHPHKDTDALTIIAPDAVGGLEVRQKDGTWSEPACPKGGFIVNIGDMLELWSGGRLVSTPHRVVNRSGRERYSFPYFAVPRHDVTVAPLLPSVAGFERPSVHCGTWSAEIWRTNWQDQDADEMTPELGTISD